MSILIPLGLFLNVGGNSENIAKFTVLPAADGPLNVTVNRLSGLLALADGLIGTKTCVQVVEGVSVTVALPRTVPLVVSRLRDAVRLVEGVVEGKRKKNEALYVHEELTLKPQ